MTSCDIFARRQFAARLVAALALAACANKPTGQRRQADAAGAAAPGSQQDFVVNVGDRVFFETDSDRLTPQARATLDKQAQWLQQLQPLYLHHRRPCRRARHARIQYRARRPPRAGGARLSRRPRHRADRMRTISYGKERPVAVCNDISCWSQNRRAVTVLNASRHARPGTGTGRHNLDAAALC